MKSNQRLVALAAAWLASPAFAIVGCLTPEVELSKRAQVVATGVLDKLERRTVAACPPPPDHPEAGPRLTGYSKCGEVRVLTVRVRDTLKGARSNRLEVFVANEGPLRLSCDDRPEPEKMVGFEVVIFAESDGTRLWTLDGPDSLYSSWPSKTFVRDQGKRVK